MIRWVTMLIFVVTWTGSLQVAGLAAIPQEVLGEALSAFQRGQFDLFKMRVSESLQLEWKPSVYGPHFTLVKVPKQELGNVGFSLVREIARSLRDYFMRETIGSSEASLAVDYLLKLVRSRSPHPDLYYFVVQACWIMLHPPLARYVDQHGTSELRKRFTQLEQLYKEDRKYIATLRDRVPRGDVADNVAGRRIVAYAAKRLPLWEKKLLEVRRLLEASNDRNGVAKP